MIPGADEYYQCPKCANNISRGTLISGNTVGALRYSDAKVVAQMLPKFPQITKCIKCGNIFWIKNELLVSEPEKGNADKAQFLSTNDYFEALNNNIFSTKNDEIYIRQHIWWKFNDRVRQGKEIFLTENDEEKWKQNLHSLLGLIDINKDGGKLLIIEINRNLGHFDICKKILIDIDNPDFEWVKEKFEKEVEKENTYVIQL